MNDFSQNLPPISDRSGITDSVRVQILAVEHWDLLATRSMIWNQIFSRASMFITLTSAVVVALALVSQATHFDARFRLFALLILPIMLVLGFATFIHLGEANGEDAILVMRMNRLRRAYLELAPELRPYFPPVPDDDAAVITRPFATNLSAVLINFLGATPAIVATINVLVVGVMAALIAELLGAPGVSDIMAGILFALAMVAVQALVVYRRVAWLRRGLRSK